MAGRGTSGGGNPINTNNFNQRSLCQSNHQTTLGQTSVSARAPSILTIPRNRSHSTILHQIAQYQVGYSFRGSAFDAELSFPPDDEQSISTLSRESMVQELFVLTFTSKDLLQQLLLIRVLHLTSLIY